MRIHDKFIYLHPPKTGGWTVRRILERAELGELPVGMYQHCGIADLPVHPPRFTFATVREPCAWYRSYFHYNCHRDGRFKPGLQAFFGTEPMVLKEALRKMLSPQGSPDPALPMFGLKTHGGRRQISMPTIVAHREIGPYSWMLSQLLNVGGAWKLPYNSNERLFSVDLVLDTAAIRSELGLIMGGLQLDITDALAATADDNVNSDIVAAGRDILPYEGTTAEVFDDEMREWVYHKERHIVELMGYTGPGEPATNGTVELP